MKIKTKGKCSKCGELYGAAQAGRHLLTCILSSDSSLESTTDGYLLRISCAEQPSMYWMFVSITKSASLGYLDGFLRDTWLECCDHLSEFRVAGHSYLSHTSSGNTSRAMNNRLEKLFSKSTDVEYIYDMGSSTHLNIQLIEEIPVHPKETITLLMQNEMPSISCELCNKLADVICALCRDTTCSLCSKQHSCVLNEEDDYMIMPLVNSPRTGVCGYTGD